MRLSDAIQGFYLDNKLSFSRNTARTYQYVFDEFITFVNDMDIERIESSHVKRFLLHLSERPARTRSGRLSRRSVYDALPRLSSLWTWAGQELGIPHIMKGGKVKKPAYTEKTINPFTADEIAALVQAAEFTKGWQSAKSGKATKSKRATALRDKAIILVLLDSGMRATELCNLTIADYESKRGRLHIVKGKGSKERYVVVGSRAQKSLWRYLADRGETKPTDPLFATASNSHLDRVNLHKLLVRVGERAGVANVHPHKFRHTMAIQFLRNGGSVLLLQELLGHEKLETTTIYVRFAQQDIDAAVAHSPADNWRI